MSGFKYSHARDNSGNFYPPEESEMRTSLGSPWSPPQYSHQRSTSYSSLDPLMQSPPYMGAPETPYLQTRFSYLKEADQHKLQQHYSSKKQLFRLLGRMLFRFLVSAACCGAIVTVFIYYEKKGVLDRDQKHIFNALFLGLSLILSMNLISAFKSMADMIRWRLLANSKHTLREVDLILGLSSFQKVLALLWTWTRGGDSTVDYALDEKPTVSKRWAFRLGAASWILLGVAAQVDVALIGLTFNHESEGAIGYTTGPVNITELEAIHADYSDPIPTISDQKYTAHLFGLMSTNYPAQDYAANLSIDTTTLIYHEDTNAWTYYFREWAATSDNANQIPVATNRSVTAYSECVYSAITTGQYGENNGTIELWNYTDNTNTTIDWMKGSAPNSTIAVNAIWEDSGPNTSSCGPRCSRIYMFQFIASDSAPGEYGAFFNCTISLSEVENADLNQPVHQLPDHTALIISGAFGSEGWKDVSGRQSSRYGPASVWGASNGWGAIGEKYAAWTIGKFTIGVIAAYDAHGPMVPAFGKQSWVGVTLVVKWLQLGICLGSILIINFCLGLFVVFKANAVFCKDDSYLSTSRLLRPLMERLGPSGSVCDGKVLSTTFTRKVVYGVRVSNGIHHLDMGENIAPLRTKFPDGAYD